MRKPNLLLATSSFNQFKERNFDRMIRKNFNPIYNPYKRKLTKVELIKLLNLNEIHYVVAGLEHYCSDVLKNTKLKIISRLGSGISNIDIKFSKKKKIKVFSTPNEPADAVSELTLSMMIAMLREVFDSNYKMHKKLWQRESGNLLYKKNVLIIGYGRIGKRVKQLLAAFKPNIIIYDKMKKYKKNINYMPLKVALPKADIITFHTSGEEEILGKNEFRLLKKGVVICNVSRGSVINEKQLISSVKRKIVKKVWLDVFNTEPYTGEMTKYKNIIMTPHIGSFTVETRKKMEKRAIENIINNI